MLCMYYTRRAHKQQAGRQPCPGARIVIASFSVGWTHKFQVSAAPAHHSVHDEQITDEDLKLFDARVVFST